MADLKYYGINILNHGLEVRKGNVSGSATSTGSFGLLKGGVETGLGNLSDITLSTPTDGQVLAYTGSIDQWVNKGLSSAGVGLGQKHQHTQSTEATTWTITSLYETPLLCTNIQFRLYMKSFLTNINLRFY